MANACACLRHPLTIHGRRRWIPCYWTYVRTKSSYLHSVRFSL